MNRRNSNGNQNENRNENENKRLNGYKNGNRNGNQNGNQNGNINGNKNGNKNGNGNGNGSQDDIMFKYIKKELLKAKKSCVKKIGTNKYERGDLTIRDWWEQQFQALEDLGRMPFYKRTNHLKKCYSIEKLKELRESGIEFYPDWGQDLAALRIPELVEPPKEELLTAKKKTFESVLKEPEKYSNPYLNFFSKSKSKAQIWRPKPLPSLDKFPLVKRVELLEEKLATEFDDWFRNVGSKAKTEIDKEVIIKIFEMVLSYPVLTSICTRIFEIGSVPQITADYLGFPEKSASDSVQRAIRKDINAGNLKPRMVAFNRSLPIELRRKPFTENLKEKWLEYQMQRQDLETMAAVWRGITHLQTTKIFLQWLLDNPHIKAPTFLKNEGIIDQNFVDKSFLDLDNISMLEKQYGIGKDKEGQFMQYI